LAATPISFAASTSCAGSLRAKRHGSWVILGASGAGKSSFLRAGLWPRLNRDDAQWLPLRAIRAGRSGAIEGGEGLLAALMEVHRRFGQQVNRSDLRNCLEAPDAFIELLGKLRRTAAQRALISEPPYPLPILCVDQGEELFGADAGPESEQFLCLARSAIDSDAALLLIAVRSDAYGLMQTATALAGVNQVPLSLGPVPHGETLPVVGTFRSPFATKWPEHHRCRSQDISPCFQFSWAPAGAAPLCGFRFSGRSALPWSGAASAFRTHVVEADYDQPTDKRRAYWRVDMRCQNRRRPLNR
jgi:hypothetical protein